MPAFELPQFETFKDNVISLSLSYSLNCGRYRPYQLLPNETHITDEDTFARLVERCIKRLKSSTTNRDGSQDALLQLAEELRDFVKNTETMGPVEHKKAVKTATIVLLGALIYRRLRLEDGGPNEKPGIREANAMLISVNSWLPAFIQAPVYIPENSDLYQDIIHILLLREKNSLDDLTILTALELFKSNMLKEVQIPGKEEKVSRFRTYHYLNNDEFLPKLDAQINKYKSKASKELIEYKAIDFLRTLAYVLDRDQRYFTQEFTELCGEWEKKHKTKPVKISDVESFVEIYCKNKPQRLKAEFLYALKTEKMGGSSNTVLEYEDFKQKMKDVNSEWRTVVLYGGCVLLLKKGTTYNSLLSDRLGDQLASSIKECLKTTKDHDKELSKEGRITKKDHGVELSVEDLKLAITFFKEYIKHRTSPHPTSLGKCIVDNLSDLNWGYFGDFEEMMDEVNSLSNVLDKISRNAQPAVNTEAPTQTFYASTW